MMRKSITLLAPVLTIAFATLALDSALAQYGPDTCRQGYVWREAYQGDHVCVRPWVRAQARRDNWRTQHRYRYH